MWNGHEFSGAVGPNMLRTCRDPYKPELLRILAAEQRAKLGAAAPAEDGDFSWVAPSRAGLDELLISGSSQFGRRGLQTIIDLITERGGPSQHIVVCDLRGEPHMILNGFPVSWYNRGDKLGANLPPVKCDELTRKYVRSVYNHSQVDIHKILTKDDMGSPETTEIHTVDVKCIETEEMLVHREFRLGYNRVPITDHEAPEIADADQLVAFYQSSPPATWWHFHCAGGKGRTTTAMVCVDMLRTRHSHPELTAQDIITRHWLIGGLRLDVPEIPTPEAAWKHQDAILRRKFLDVFYSYTRDHAAHRCGLMFFSTWIESKEITWPPI